MSGPTKLSLAFFSSSSRVIKVYSIWRWKGGSCLLASISMHTWWNLPHPPISRRPLSCPLVYGTMQGIEESPLCGPMLRAFSYQPRRTVYLQIIDPFFLPVVVQDHARESVIIQSIAVRSNIPYGAYGLCVP